MTVASHSQEASRSPDLHLPCPHCGPHRRDPANRKRKVLGVWKHTDGTETMWCIRCGYNDQSASTGHIEPAPSEPKLRADNGQLASRIWARRQPIGGTPAEAYLRVTRAITCPLPATLTYLPAYDRYPHAMIAAFGLCEEIEPGILAPPETVTAIHLTDLAEDGLSRTDKRMIGPVSGQPLVLALPNDALGLIIAEGIEDALSLHEATGLGVWAGGSAGHMAKLGNIVPDYIDCVTIAEDLNAAGRKATSALASLLRSRGIEVRVFRPHG